MSYIPIDKIFVTTGRVYFSHTDAAGVVYHSNYVDFLEASRIELMDQLGCPYADFIADHIGMSPVTLSLKYHFPLRFSDYFEVHTSFTEISKASFTLDCKIMKGDVLCCSGIVKLACIDEQSWKPRRLPELFLDKVLIR